MKAGYVLGLALCVIVSLALPAAGYSAMPIPGDDGSKPDLPDAPQGPGTTLDETVEGFAGGASVGAPAGVPAPGDPGAPPLPAAPGERCTVLDAGDAPIEQPTSVPVARAMQCGNGAAEEPEPAPDDGQAPAEPAGPTLPDLREAGRELADAVGGAAGAAGAAADDAQREARSLLGRLLEPVQELGSEATRVARETAAAIESATGLVVHQVGRTADYAVAAASQAVQEADAFVAGVLDDLVASLLPAPSATNAGEDGALQPLSSVDAPLRPVSKSALGAVIAGGVGLALAAFAALRRLLGLGGATLLSRIPSAEIMKNETRSQIHDIVKSDPGVSLNEIVDRMGISRNAVAYHLAVFESEELMTSVKDGKYRRYFLNGGKYANGAKNVVSTIKNDVTRNVIRFITENPGAIQKDVCQAVGTSPSATSWHIRRLEKVGLVEKERVANMVRYRPGPSIARYDLTDFGLGREAAPLVAPA